MFDKDLSRLVIGSLVWTYFCEVIMTCFSHYNDSEYFSGQVYFMVFINACNTYASIDIEGIEKYFIGIPLNEFTGEIISDIDTTALRHIKVMHGAYNVLPKFGITLLLNVFKTSSVIFNQNILNYYASNN